MLYEVEWELASWVNRCRYLVDLSPEELKELEGRFDAPRQKGILWWGIRKADIRSLESVRSILEDDLKTQEAPKDLDDPRGKPPVSP